MLPLPNRVAVTLTSAKKEYSEVAPCEIYLKLLQKKKKNGIDPAILLPGNYPKERKLVSQRCLHLVFTAALFTTAKTWKQAKCPIDGQITTEASVIAHAHEDF